MMSLGMGLYLDLPQKGSSTSRYCPGSQASESQVQELSHVGLWKRVAHS